jgi:hypothetical protein
MTTNFRGGVFSSHKPHRRLPRASENPKHQKNSPIYLELSIPKKFGNSYFLQGQISPEPPGTSKQSLARPLGSQEAKLQLSNIISNSKKSMQKFISERKIKVFRTQNYNQEENLGSRTLEKHNFKEFFNPITRKNQLLNVTLSLVNIPSIILELPDNQKEPMKNIQNILSAQISRQKWENFFRIISGFNFKNFSVMDWIKGDQKGIFEINEYKDNRRNRGTGEMWTLNYGRTQRWFIQETEGIIKRNDDGDRTLFRGWCITPR